MLTGPCLTVTVAVCLAVAALTLARPLHVDLVLPQGSDADQFLADEGAVRSERSANISHIVGISRKIQLVVNKYRYLQIFPDGTVNGTDGDDNDYSILQRSSVNNFQITIQGVATCSFLCMDHCGFLYGSKEFSDECVFNEMMQIHHFNTYSSAKYSNDKRALYLALNKKGVSRKVQTKANAPLGKLGTYTNVLTKPVPTERVEALVMRILKARVLAAKALPSSAGDARQHPLRHHGFSQLCASIPYTASSDKTKFRCRKKEKRKKDKKCRDEDDETDCQLMLKKKPNFSGKKKCEEDEDDEECQKRLYMIRKKRKSRNGDVTGGKPATSPPPEVVNEKNTRRKRLKPEKKMTKPKCLGKNIGLKKCAPKGNLRRNVKAASGEHSRSHVVDTTQMTWREVFGLRQSEEVSDRGWTDSTTERDVAEDSTTINPETSTPEEDEDDVAEAFFDWTTSAAVHD